jgi:hypothetical protein
MPDPPIDGALADRLTRAARASQELCEVLWEELQEELRAPRSARVRELSERLAAVAATVSALARESAPGAWESAPEPAAPAPAAHDPFAAPLRGPSSPASPARTATLLIDEREGAVEIRDVR